VASGGPGAGTPPDVPSYRAPARELNRFGAAAAERGLRFFHNHDGEFARSGGRVRYDVLRDATGPGLVFFELDLSWIVAAGGDPLVELARHDQGRWALLHVKDRTRRGRGGTFTAPART